MWIIHAEAFTTWERSCRGKTLSAFGSNTGFCLAPILSMPKQTDDSGGSALAYQSRVAQDEARWKEEAAFFDRDADGRVQEVLPVEPQTLRRYTARLLRRRSSAEFRFRVAKNLQGKRVLDVGCGDGNNSVLLAKLGAHVTGIDVSPKSIQVAKKRAEVNGVSNLVQFVCSPVEEAEIPPHSFDVIWGDAILHHMIENLEFVLQQLTLWAKPGALMLFSEPVNLNRTLRRLRFAFPIETDVTPGERPLEPSELKILKRFLPELRIRFYSFFGRLDRFILIGYNYERSPLWRQIIANSFAYLDYALLSLPVARNMAGYAVFYGRSPK